MGLAKAGPLEKTRAMHLITIPVGEFQVSTDAEAVLVTDSLGSCIAVTIYDPVAHVGGLLHAQLSEFCSGPACVRHLFADTGVSKLLEESCRRGAKKDRLIVTIAGGGQLAQEASPNGGKKNYLAVRKSLWKLGVMLESEAVGGTAVRSVRLEVATGKCWLP